MSLEQFLFFYFAANLFLSGMYFGQGIEWVSNTGERVYLILVTLLYMAFGLVVVCGEYTTYFFKSIYEKLNSYFQINFWFRFYFTKNYNNIEHYALERLNKFANEKPTGVSGRIYRHCVKLINKRNGYTYVESTEPQF